MQDNQKNRNFVEKYAKIYCKFYKLKYKKIKFIYTKKKLAKYEKKYNYKHSKPDKSAGITLPDEKIIYVNFKNNKTRKFLQDTIAHELVHIAAKKLSHGRIFEIVIQSALKNCRK